LRSQAKTQHESAGFFVFKAFKTCFDKHLKIKRPKIAQAILGFKLGLNQKMGTRVSVIPLLY
jgi:hypothetical protein